MLAGHFVEKGSSDMKGCAQIYVYSINSFQTVQWKEGKKCCEDEMQPTFTYSKNEQKTLSIPRNTLEEHPNRNKSHKIIIQGFLNKRITGFQQLTDTLFFLQK